jgi:hypothetical protein
MGSEIWGSAHHVLTDLPTQFLTDGWPVVFGFHIVWLS